MIEFKELVKMRNKIDEIDASLMSLLDKRADIVRVIGEIKKKENISVFNKIREDEIIAKTCQFSNAKFVSAVFVKILDESKKIQEEKWK